MKKGKTFKILIPIFISAAMGMLECVFNFNSDISFFINVLWWIFNTIVCPIYLLVINVKMNRLIDFILMILCNLAVHSVMFFYYFILYWSEVDLFPIFITISVIVDLLFFILFGLKLLFQNIAERQD